MGQRPGAKARRGVIITSMVMLVLQIIGFLCTVVFYWFASSDGTRYFLSRAVFTALYHREDWPYLKRQHALEVNFLELFGSQTLKMLFFIINLWTNRLQTTTHFKRT